MKGPARSARVAAVLSVCLALASISVLLAHASRSQDVAVRVGNLKMKKMAVLVQHGLGTQVVLSGPGSSAAEIEHSANTVRTFIRTRSGLDIGAKAERRLAVMEERTLNGSSRRITIDELSDILVQTLVERTRRVTDSDIVRAASIMSGDKSADALSRTLQVDSVIRVRADGRGITADKFISDAKMLRAAATSPAMLLPLVASARDFMGQEIRRRISPAAAAMPQDWGRAAFSGLTPLQAMITSYSIASDDYLWYSDYELRGIMESVEISRKTRNASAPSSYQRVAYGSEGYLFATPLDLLLDGPTITRLLDRVEERSAK